MTASPLLSLETVSKRYWRGQRPIDVLEGVSLDLEPGELAAVWGARSAGKTTLLEVAAGLRRPDAGRVWFAGRDLACEPLLAEISVATRQGPTSRDLPVCDWVAMALFDRVGSRKAQRRAHQALGRVGVGEVAREPWTNLSDGERTLATIAHAIVREPCVLLIDDVNAGLSLLERGEVMALLRSLADDGGVAVLMTAAEVGDAQGARPIWSLGGGRLIGRRAPGAGTVIDFPARDAPGRG